MSGILSSGTDRLDFLVQALKQQCPWVKIGERIETEPVRLRGGKVEPAPSQPVYELDFFPIPFGEDTEEWEVKIFFDLLNRLDELEASLTSRYGRDFFLYPRSVTIPHLALLRNQKVGDQILVMGKDGQAHQVVLTEELLQKHSYLIFKFTVSSR